jgi:adenylylsulfate kinase
VTKVVVISGTVGSGKTTIATRLHDKLVQRGYASAVIDVDFLCEAEPRTPDDPYNSDLGIKNLAAIWPNYKEFGVEYMVLARVVEEADERAKYDAAFGIPVKIVRLEVPSALRKERLIERESEPQWLEWHLNRTDELAAIMRERELEDFVVVNDERSPDDTVAEIIRLLGW